jgi:nicotinate phosphoribosyltransferase
MIIQSLLDTDLYKITMGQVIFNQFPRARARYRLINRGAMPFPEGLGDRLGDEVRRFDHLQAKGAEIDWLLKKVRYLKPTYLEWLAHYRFKPEEVTIRQAGCMLEVEVSGPWYRTVFWEVPLLAVISELYFADRQPLPGWEDRITGKAERMASVGAHWVDFGTRRRFSYQTQDAVNQIMSRYRPFFAGTSNPHMAMKYDVTPIGTYAHEGPMAMQVLAGVACADQVWMDAWVEEYQGDLGIALTDTLTSEYFFRQFGLKEAKLFDGVRQDSGDSRRIAEKAIAHYQSLHIDPRSKHIIFSDSLTDDKLMALHKEFSDRIRVSGGIGTYLTNDVGHQPLNMVIKMTEADFGNGWVPVIKLSDDPGKQSGDPSRLAAALVELGMSK